MLLQLLSDPAGLLSDPISFLISMLIFFGGLIIAITIHEFAHAWIADKLGDPTPRYQGRVSLNPLAHLNPLGTVALLVTGFGWGKPVQFDPYNLKNPLRDTATIALAGPVSNMIIAILISIAFHIGLVPLGYLSSVLASVLVINVSLAVFNLVPVYPLDGSKVLLALLPRETALEYDDFMHRYGFIVLLLLIFPWAGGMSPVSQLISPVITWVVNHLL